MASLVELVVVALDVRERDRAERVAALALRVLGVVLGSLAGVLERDQINNYL